jgi:hypothetical protein
MVLEELGTPGKMKVCYSRHAKDVQVEEKALKYLETITGGYPSIAEAGNNFSKRNRKAG